MILLLFVLIPLLALWAFVSALAFVSSKLRPTHFLPLLAVLLAVPVAAWKYYERGFMLQAVPDALHVRSVLYALEESWGFGPGGN